MIKIIDPKECCGCTACASICAHDAISMEPDALGFLYPKVDESRCVGCGLCEKVCQFNENYDCSLNLPQPIAYAARHKDINEVMKSRSGAAFVAISDYILEQGGVVYGAGYKDHFRVAHKRATTKEERDEFRGSKYVQSDLTGVFRQVKEDLKNGLIVLFSGTGCQCAGLNSYVGKRSRNNLVLVDIVCHGVPSPFIWKDYLNYIEKKERKNIFYADFRDKSERGWKSHFESFTFADGHKKHTSMYRQLFYAHINLRWSCYNCHYCNLIRTGDISLADYWGWQRTDPNFNADDKGCSLVLCNTEKGRDLFETVKDKMDTILAELANVTQKHLLKPSKIHPRRMDFERYYVKGGFEYAAKKTDMIGWRNTLKMIKRKICKLLK